MFLVENEQVKGDREIKLFNICTVWVIAVYLPHF